jgi:antitoxin component YwqK of YwqJK toxin-antitoxin module
MGRLEELEKQHQRSAARAGIGDTPPPAPRRTGGSPLKWILPLLLLLLIGGGAAWWWMNAGGSEAAKLAKVADQKREAVGVVVAIATDAEGRQIMRPFATAWALEPDLYITNAHVADTARRLAADGARIAVMVNQRPDLVFPVRSLRMHPLHGATRAATTASGEVGFAYDVAALRVEGRAPATFAVAPAARLEALAAGTPVAYLGFPMENLVGGGVSLHNPVAVMQTGILTAVSDFRQETNLPRNHLLLRHNLGLTGGASGSPLFDTSGRVVGILNAGNMVGQVLGLSDDRQLIMGRTPSAVMINFAQRADLIDGLGPETALVPGDRAAPTYTVADFPPPPDGTALTDFIFHDPFPHKADASAPLTDDSATDLTPSPLAVIDLDADIEGLRESVFRNHENGKPAIIRYYRGNERVRERHFHDNGQIAIDRPLQNGKADGPERRFFRTGRRSSETEYVAGQKHGRESSFHSVSGHLTSVTIWERGRIKEPTIFYSRDGSLMHGNVDFFFHNETETGITQTLAIRRHLVNGRMHGPHTHYHRNGNKSWEGTFADGWREGVFTYWQENGLMIRSLRYDRDEKHPPMFICAPSGLIRRASTYLTFPNGDKRIEVMLIHRNGSSFIAALQFTTTKDDLPVEIFIAFDHEHNYSRWRLQNFAGREFLEVEWMSFPWGTHKNSREGRAWPWPPAEWRHIEEYTLAYIEAALPGWQDALLQRHAVIAIFEERYEQDRLRDGLSHDTIHALNAADMRFAKGEIRTATQAYAELERSLR